MSHALPSHWRRRWQVPVFLLGVTAFTLACLLAPRPAPTPAEQVAKALQRAWALHREGEPALVLAAVQAGWETGAATPDQQAEMRFLQGAAYLRLAHGGGSKDLPAEDAWRRARSDLEQAGQLPLSEPHRPAWALSLATAHAKTGASPARVIEVLEPYVAQLGHQREAAYELLVGQYLKLTPPDRLAAAKTLERWLMLPQVADANALRLQLAEQLLALERYPEARQVLVRVSSHGPDGMKAGEMLARCLLALRDYQAAATLLRRLWPAAPGPEQPRLRYLLGTCLSEVGEVEEAVAEWRAAAEGTSGPVAFAARVRLGQALASRDVELALKSWEQAFATTPPLTWDQPFLTPGELRTSWEATWQMWMTAGHFAAAARLADAARAWLPPGISLERRGAAHQAAGRAAVRAAEAGQGQLWTEARAHFRAAAAAFEEAATLPAATPEQRDEWQWQAAENLLRAQNYPRAVVLLELCLAGKLSPRRRAEALIGLAEALHAQGARPRALRVLAEALPHAGPLEVRARYLQALIYIEMKDYAQAENTLSVIASTSTLLPEPVEVRQARFALGYVLHWQQRYAEAATALESAIRWHPNSPEALEARYWWADALLQAALQLSRSASRDAKSDSAREYYEQRRRQWLQAALDHFQEFLSRAGEREWTPEWDQLVRAGRFGMGDVLFQLERPAEAAQVFETLALAHDQELDGVKALRQLTLCLIAQRKTDQARVVLAQVRQKLAALPDNHFLPPRQSRSDWERWLRQTEALVETPTP